MRKCRLMNLQKNFLDNINDRIKSYSSYQLKNALSDLKYEHTQKAFDNTVNALRYNFALNYIQWVLKGSIKDHAGEDVEIFGYFFNDLQKFHLKKLNKDIRDEIMSIIKNQAQNLGHQILSIH